MYWRFTPAVALPAFSCPVSSTAPTVIPPRRRRRAACSSPATANRRTTLIAAACPRPRGSAAAASCPASGPRHAGRCSTRSPAAARRPAPTRTCPPAATAPSGQNTAAAAPAARPVSAAPARRLSLRQQPPLNLYSSHRHDQQAAALTRGPSGNKTTSTAACSSAQLTAPNAAALLEDIKCGHHREYTAMTSTRRWWCRCLQVTCGSGLWTSGPPAPRYQRRPADQSRGAAAPRDPPPNPAQPAKTSEPEPRCLAAARL